MKMTIKEALLDREVTFGTWIQIGPYPALAEILANAGYDWLAVDCEHSDIDVEGFTNLARGMHGRGAVPLARVRENDTLAIRQVLDAGSQGVIVPLINTREDAEKAVAAAKYPPQGIRGFCFSRMNNYGFDFDQYAARANDEVAVVVMIESKEAVENIDAILSVDGVDGILVGPYDMSGSYGLTGQTDHPVLRNACRVVIQACERHQKSAGLHLVKPTPESVSDTLCQGFTFIALGVDMVFLRQAARESLKAARQAIAIGAGA